MNQKTGLILLSHGSVVCGAGRDLFYHADRLRRSAGFVCVEIGFLNYCKPSLAEALSSCESIGVREIVIVPYFLVPGHFARKVVQNALDVQSTLAEPIKIRIAEPIGYDSRIASVILHLSSAGKGPESWRSVTQGTLDACVEDPKCPLYGSSGCRGGIKGEKVG